MKFNTQPKNNKNYTHTCVYSQIKKNSTKTVQYLQSYFVIIRYFVSFSILSLIALVYFIFFICLCVRLIFYGRSCLCHLLNHPISRNHIFQICFVFALFFYLIFFFLQYCCIFIVAAFLLSCVCLCMCV